MIQNLPEHLLHPMRALANIYGVMTEYTDNEGEKHHVTLETLMIALKAMGAEIESPEDAEHALAVRQKEIWDTPIEPVHVIWDRAESSLEIRLSLSSTYGLVRYTIELENGQTITQELDRTFFEYRYSAQVAEDHYVSKRLPLPADLPFGYHQLTLEMDEKTYTCLLIVAPIKAYEPPKQQAKPAWGVFLPLYALQSKGGLGAGDFGDMERLMDWSAQQGASVMGTLPLSAAFLQNPCDFSPYTPVSRLFWNEFYIDLEQLPGINACAAARKVMESKAFTDEVKKLRKLKRVDYERIMTLKVQVLEALSKHFFKQPAKAQKEFKQFLTERPEVKDYARFRATLEKQGHPFHGWTPARRQGRLRSTDFDADRLNYHMYVQWVTELQLAALAQKARQIGPGLYLDYPLGVHPDGYDVWRYGEHFAQGVSGGAPPDAFFSKGQDWGFRPMHPRRIRELQYDYYIQCVRQFMHHAGMLRIDHVMGLFRLYWVPIGAEATQGVYVRYDANEMLAILCLESHRNQVMIIGEDLGTVPKQVRDLMAQHRLARMYVEQFDVTDDPEEAVAIPEPGMVGSLNTHDTPTFEGFRQGLDAGMRVQLGLIDEEEAEQIRHERLEQVTAMAEFFRQHGWLNGQADGAGLMKAALKFLAASDAQIMLINLEDLWLETRQQNTPGTTTQMSNWQNKAAQSFEQFSKDPDIIELLSVINQLRQRCGEPVETSV